MSKSTNQVTSLGWFEQAKIGVLISNDRQVGGGIITASPASGQQLRDNPSLHQPYHRPNRTVQSHIQKLGPIA